MLTTLEEAKRAGATIVAINPLPEAGLLRFKNPQRPGGLFGSGTQLADEHLPIRINGDLAFFKAVNHLLVTAGDTAGDTALDTDVHRAVHEWLRGLRRRCPLVRLGALRARHGIHPRGGRTFTEHVRASERIIVCWAMGLTQHANSVATIREIVNFLLPRGNIGRPGAGVCPVRGHSNVQGDRTMGISERPAPAFLDALGRRIRVRATAGAGLDTVDTIGAMRDGRRPGLRRHGWQLRVGDARHRGDPRRARTLPAHGAGVDETQHVACRHRRPGADPADDGPHRTPRGRRCRTGRHRRGLDGRRARVARHVAQGRAAAAERSRDRLWPRRSAVRRLRRVRRSTGADSPATTRPSATRSAGSCRASTTSTRRSPSPAASSCRTVHATTGPSRRRRSGAVHGQRAQPCRGTAPGTLLLQTIRSHDQYNTTIYGLDDRYRGIHNGRRVVFVALTTSRRWPPRRRRGRSAIGRRRRRRTRGAPASGSSTTRPRPAAARPTTPRPTCSSPCASTNAAGTPTFKSIPVNADLSHGSGTS